MTGTYNILLVEDNPMDVILIKKSLARVTDQITLTIKENGAAALEYLESLKAEAYPRWPDLIITDINMPKINGLELIKILKQDKFMKLIPTVLFSGSDEEKDIQSAYDLNVSCYIVKPFDVRKYQNIFSYLWSFWSQSARLPAFYAYPA